jgi:Fur family transcriptional regulator, ferric uptake regulator
VQRSTRQRDVLRAVFTSAPRPLGPREAMALAQQSLPSLGIATVYRAIKDLLAKGWLVPVTVSSGTRFEPADRGHHHHFYCQACDRAFDLDGCASNLSRLVPAGFVVESHELTITGLCDACADDKRGAGGER